MCVYFALGSKRCTSITCIVFLAVSFLASLMFLRENTFLPVSLIITSMARQPKTNVTISDTTQQSQRVICMILTTPSNWATRGRAVRNTWAKRCHKAIFFYTKVGDCNATAICKDPDAVGLNIPDGRDHLTAKSRGILSYSYTKYSTDGDYFLKADDDTYVVMENLQSILRNFSSQPRLYLGRTIHTHLPKGYNSGGAGYIISNEAAKLIVQNGSSYPNECHADGGFEDVEIGRCLAKFGIYPQDEMDSSGRLTFHSDNPFLVFKGDPVSNYYYINFADTEFGNKKAKDTRGYMLSERTATMHYISPPEMYMYEFLLYHLKKGTNN